MAVKRGPKIPQEQISLDPADANADPRPKRIHRLPYIKGLTGPFYHGVQASAKSTSDERSQARHVSSVPKDGLKPDPAESDKAILSLVALEETYDACRNIIDGTEYLRMSPEEFVLIDLIDEAKAWLAKHQIRTLKKTRHWDADKCLCKDNIPSLAKVGMCRADIRGQSAMSRRQ